MNGRRPSRAWRAPGDGARRGLKETPSVLSAVALAGGPEGPCWQPPTGLHLRGSTTPVRWLANASGFLGAVLRLARSRQEVARGHPADCANIHGMGRWTEGQTVGRYQLLRRLGTGSFAEVWLADDRASTGFTRPVAIKLLKGSDPDDEKTRTFMQEARLAAGLRHPNIVDIQRVDEVDGALLVAMEYMDGGTLAAFIERSALADLRVPRSVVVDIGIDIARALAHAHHAEGDDGEIQRIVHRDLKPANVLLGRSGVAKVTDFGIAKAVGDATATATGALKGTPAYIPPESWELQREFLPRVDLFALGCILWELVQLRRLFEGDSIAVIFRQIATGDVRSEIEPIARGFPGLAPILGRLLQRTPDQRYQDAADVLGDLLELRAAMPMDGHTGDFLELLGRVAEPASAVGMGLQGSRLVTSADPAWAAAVEHASGERPIADMRRESLNDGGPGEVGARTIGAVGASASLPPALGSALPPPIPPAARAEPSRDETDADSEPRGTQSVIVTPPRAEDERRRYRAFEFATRAVLALSGLLVVALAVVLFRSSEQAPAGAQPDPQGPDAVSERVEHHSSRALLAPPAPPEPTAPAAPPSPDQTSTGDASATASIEAAAKVAPAPAEARERPPEEAAAVRPLPEPATTVVVEPTEAAPVEPAPPDSQAEDQVVSVRAPDKGCLVLTSKPAGARVWLDGQRVGARATSSPSRGLLRRPSTINVGMGSGSEPAVSVPVDLIAGRGARIDCELQVRKACTVSTIPFAVCSE